MLAVELRQTRDRQLAEVQSQRLEALGRLTGGVAHDLNNLLTPIVGGLDLVRRRVKDDPQALRNVEAAAASADRARALVARLLSFARRQTLSAEDLEIGPLLADLRDLLVRTLGPSIVIETAVQEGLPPVHADRGQLELAILNLAINARDAMPSGGTVVIQATAASEPVAAGLPARDYIAISVTDSGLGMDERTLRQATEPFFTTKPVGEGTGLGLSMVHGFAAQSGGTLHLTSTPGQGTVATILLPRGGQAVAPAKEADKESAPRRAVRILLVDDEEMVRHSTAEMLREIGYTVIEAPSVAVARQILRTSDRFDVVLTDYLMPDETGADLVSEVRAHFPDMPIMLLTGYADGATDVDPTIPRLIKPFRLAELAEKLAPLSD
ncbi:MAG: response regulator [Sphingomonadales bacterium]|nr:response regulator [Sphingomonadales bacterium]